MKQSFKDILKYKINNKIIIKKEIKKKILKSIIQNNYLKTKIKIISTIKLQKLLKSLKFTKYKNICLMTGKKKSIYNFCNFSRHTIKQLNIKTKLQNIKIKS
jgi:hypothetical protein